MYEKHWGITRRPFDNDLAHQYYFQSRSHKAAMLKLKYVIENNLGAAVLVGPVGSGKSYISNLLTADTSESVGPFVHVLFPQMPAAELLCWITNDLAGDLGSGTNANSLSEIVTSFERQLVAINRAGRRPVIVIDDAHLIEDSSVFDALQQLLNFSTYPDRNFTMILCGQPSLLSRVQRIPALNDRIAARSVIQPLTSGETAQYIQHRLATAGTQQPVFATEAVEKIFENSNGIPRRINWLCEMALLVGFADGLTQITPAEIEAVAEELSVAA